MTATLPAHRDALLRIAVGFTGVLLLAACASTPPAPSASMQAAQRAISQAEGAEAGRYAPTELSEARAKLASADTAAAEQKMTMAERFAEESRVEAELASAKTADTQRFGAFFRAMRESRVFLPPSQFEAWFPSLAHTPARIEETIEAATAAFARLGKPARGGGGR